MEFGIEEGKIILNLREMANNAKISIYGSFMSNHNPKTAALVITSLFSLLSRTKTARYHYCLSIPDMVTVPHTDCAATTMPLNYLQSAS